MTRQYEWIEICEIEQGARTKTRWWDIQSKSSRNLLGYVKWYSPWRKYVFSPISNTLFDEKCLREIAEHLELATAGHKWDFKI